MKFFVLFFLLNCQVVFAKCDELFPNNKEVIIENTILLCNSFYAVKYDIENNSPIITSEKLEPFGHWKERKNSFRPDPRAPYVKPKSFARSGWDRGHMVPAGDAISESEMRDTFLMTNMTPQAPRLNRGKWRKLEMDTRKIVASTLEPKIVITGAFYGEEKLDNIPIPAFYYKIIFLDKPIAFFVENHDRAAVFRVSITELERKTGIKFK